MAEDQSHDTGLPVNPPQTAPVSSLNPADAPLAPEEDSDQFSLPNPLVLAAIGLALLAVITFLPTLRGEATWLDDVSFTDNPFVQAPDGVARFWASADRAGRFQPLTLTSFWFGARLFRGNLVAEHFINILLHALVVLMLWTLLRRLEVPGAWLAAAIFAVHPVHTQAIAWISGRSVVLASAFYLAAMLVYLRYLDLTPPSEEKTLFSLPPEPERLWGVAFVLFLLAILSNAAAAVTFPVVILVILWRKRDAIAQKDWLGILPFFVAAIAGGFWVAWLEVTSLATRTITATFGSTSSIDKIFIGFRAIWFYALKLIVPFPLIFDYPRWQAPLATGAVCALGLAGALAILWMMQKRIGRGPLAAAILFIAMIAPMLNLLDPPALRYSFVADYRQYLASAALIVLVASCAVQLVESERFKEYLNPSYSAGAVLLILAVLSFHQGTLYLTDESLWRHTIAENKSSVLGDDGYAEALLHGTIRDARPFDVARQWFQNAQSIAPNDPRAAVGLGTVAAAQGYHDRVAGHPELNATQQTAALQYFNDAIRNDPDYKPAYVALALLYTLTNNDLDAIDALKQAARIDPSAQSTRLDLGGAQRRVGQLDDAIKTLTDLAEDAPDVAAVHTELGSVYIQKQNLQAALAEWQKAIQLEPTNTTVLLNFGALLDSSGETELAAKQFQAATIIDPSLERAYVYLAHVYSKLNHRHDAVIQLRTAVELNPNDRRAQAALDNALAEEKRLGPGTSATSQSSTQAASDSTTQPVPDAIANPATQTAPPG